MGSVQITDRSGGRRTIWTLLWIESEGPSDLSIWSENVAITNIHYIVLALKQHGEMLVVPF